MLLVNGLITFTELKKATREELIDLIAILEIKIDAEKAESEKLKRRK